MIDTKSMINFAVGSYFGNVALILAMERSKSIAQYRQYLKRKKIDQVIF